jgi:UTP--glucose-1-phosphate uridylyltransferase
MKAADLPQQAIDTFLFHLGRYLAGESGTLGRDRIAPVATLPDADQLGHCREAGVGALDRVVIVKLNGGLGTGMGLESAKSLLEVRDELNFLDLIARQVQALRRGTDIRVPLMMMNSFRTERDTLRALAPYEDLEVEDLPVTFLQHRVPKVLVDGVTPAEYRPAPELEWCPPGHGDLYTALSTSGALERLLDAGIEYAFISNADNLGAVFDPALLGHMIRERIDFLMETADRTAADRKGGHLCRLSDGRLALRESAQCPPDEQDEFQDVTLYRYFNTNTIWVRLPALQRMMAEYGGVLPLTTIVNHKTLDPRDPSSPQVVQLETAMGSAISVFERSAAVRVPRTRFSPVKNTDDLLGVRSDAYRLTEDWRVVLRPDRTEPPVISLDDRYYRMIDDFEARFPDGPPSLRRCESLVVEGDVVFGGGVEIEGEVRIVVGDGARRIAPGTVLGGEVTL